MHQQLRQAVATLPGVLALVLVQTVSPVAAATLDGFNAAFEIRYMGLRADATLDLQRDETNGGWLYQVRSEARGMARLLRSAEAVESTRFGFTGETIVPRSYELQDGADDNRNDTTIHFDWEAGTAASIHEGEPAEITLIPGLQDRLSADIAVILDLREGRQPETYDILERNEIRNYVYTDMGDETVKVPAGTFTTRKFLRQRPGSSRGTLIWYATEAAYLPVRIEQQKNGKTAVTMVASRISPEN